MIRERSSDMHRQCVANWTIKARRSCEKASDRWRADTTALISEMVRTVAPARQPACPAEPRSFQCCPTFFGGRWMAELALT